MKSVKSMTLEEIEALLTQYQIVFEDVAKSLEYIHSRMATLKTPRPATTIPTSQAAWDKGDVYKVPVKESKPIKKRNGRHRKMCENPDCFKHSKRGTNRFLAHRTTQRFCSNKCKSYVRNHIATYIRIRKEGRLSDVEAYLHRYPWLANHPYSAEVTRMSKGLYKHKGYGDNKPVTILRNTPTV